MPTPSAWVAFFTEQGQNLGRRLRGGLQRLERLSKPAPTLPPAKPPTSTPQPQPQLPSPSTTKPPTTTPTTTKPPTTSPTKLPAPAPTLPPVQTPPVKPGTTPTLPPLPLPPGNTPTPPAEEEKPPTRVGGGQPTANTSKPNITFGSNPNQVYHAFRHIDEMGLDRSTVQSAIEQDLEGMSSLMKPGKPFNQVIIVSGQKIQYTAFLLPDGTINVGRIHGVD